MNSVSIVRASRAAALLFAASLAALSLAACSGNDGRPTDVNITGTWLASITITGGPNVGAQFDVTFDIVQSGLDFTGTWVNPAGASGTLEGRVNGSELAFTVFQDVPCPGVLDGAGHLPDGDTIVASYAGPACGNDVAAEFTAVRN